MDEPTKKKLGEIERSLRILNIKGSQFLGLIGFIEKHIAKPKGDKGDTGPAGYTPQKGKDYVDGKKGDKGDRGKDGYSPIRGKDYWTKEDVKKIITEAGRLVYVPQKGKDYYTKKERESIILETIELVNAGVKKPQRGVDYMTEDDWDYAKQSFKEIVKTNPQLLVTLENVKAITNLVIEDAVKIARALEKLKGKQRLDYKALKNRPAWLGSIQVGSTGGSSVSFPITVAQGGTGGTTAGAARTNLGLVPGTDIETYDADLHKRPIGFTVYHETAVTTGKVKGFFVTPYNATIVAYNFVVDAGTATVKCWKIATGTAKPTSANSINTAGVAIAANTAVRSTTLTDFTTTAVSANDIWAFEITAISGVKEISFWLELSI